MSGSETWDRNHCRAAIWAKYRYRQCRHAPKTEVAPDVILCTQHAKEARVAGSVRVIAGQSFGRVNVETVAIERDPDLVADAERKRRETFGVYRATRPHVLARQAERDRWAGPAARVAAERDALLTRMDDLDWAFGPFRALSEAIDALVAVASESQGENDAP